MHYAHHIAHVEWLMHCAHCDAWIAMPNKLATLIIALNKIYNEDAWNFIGKLRTNVIIIAKGKKISVVSILLSSLSSRTMLIIFLYRNFIKMSSQLNHMVPLFVGSNYRTWATDMTAFLRTQCLWGIFSAREARPLDLLSGRAAVVATSTSPAQPALDVTYPLCISNDRHILATLPILSTRHSII